MNEENKVVSLDEVRGEKEVAKMNTDMAKMVEWETNVLMRSIYETLTKLENPRQAIAAGMAMIMTGKDLLCLELGEEGAKAYCANLKFDTTEIVQMERQKVENDARRSRTDIPENDGGDKEGGRQWTEQEMRNLKAATSSVEVHNEDTVGTDSEGGEI